MKRKAPIAVFEDSIMKLIVILVRYFFLFIRRDRVLVSREGDRWPNVDLFINNFHDNEKSQRNVEGHNSMTKRF